MSTYESMADLKAAAIEFAQNELCTYAIKKYSLAPGEELAKLPNDTLTGTEIQRLVKDRIVMPEKQYYLFAQRVLEAAENKLKDLPMLPEDCAWPNPAFLHLFEEIDFAALYDYTLEQTLSTKDHDAYVATGKKFAAFFEKNKGVNETVREHITSFIAQIHSIYLDEEVRVPYTELTTILNMTHDRLIGRVSHDDYVEFANTVQKKPSDAIYALGCIMIALAGAIVLANCVFLPFVGLGMLAVATEVVAAEVVGSAALTIGLAYGGTFFTTTHGTPQHQRLANTLLDINSTATEGNVIFSPVQAM